MPSPHLDLPFLVPAQARKHLTVNEALERLDAVVQLSVLGTEDTPPDSAGTGDRFIVGDAPSGPFDGRAGQIASLGLGGWNFAAPQDGWLAFDRSQDALQLHKDGAWSALQTGAATGTGDGELPEQLPRLGIGTAPDETNALSVRSQATLFTAEAGSHRLAINRESDADVASVIFQTAFAGEAEMGLTGGDGLAVRVNSQDDGWVDALRVDVGDGTVRARGLATGRVEMRVFGPGTGTYTVPDGVRAVIFQLQGAGGGGAGAAVTTVGKLAMGGGGGAGAFVQHCVNASELAVSYDYAVGTGGVGGPSEPATGARSGARGGDTTLLGGDLALAAKGGGGAPELRESGGLRYFLGGAGGAASGGGVNIDGQPGGAGAVYGSVDVVLGFGTGGGSRLGAGGPSGYGDGKPGNGWGGGGAGAGMMPRIIRTAAGGPGADGALVVTEFY